MGRVLKTSASRTEGPVADCRQPPRDALPGSLGRQRSSLCGWL